MFIDTFCSQTINLTVDLPLTTDLNMLLLTATLPRVCVLSPVESVKSDGLDEVNSDYGKTLIQYFLPKNICYRFA